MPDSNSKLVYSTDPEVLKTAGEAEAPTAEKNYFLRMLLDRKQRAGKSVTVVSGFTESAESIKDISKRLKSLCATGGTIKGQAIEIQGDHRDKIEKELKKLGYKIKRAGG